MPGLTAWFPFRAGAGDADRFRAAQRLMQRKAGDVAEVDVEFPGAFVGHAGSPAHPVLVCREPRFTLVFEGRVYGRSEEALGNELVLLAARALDAADALAPVAEFVRRADGDFLAVIATKERVIAFGDALGHLPVYVQSGRAGLVIARECKFAAAIHAAWSFDRIGVAQHFWLGYPLGTRTLFEGIERAEEGFFCDVRLGEDGPLARRGRTYAIRCDDKSDTRGLGAAAADLALHIASATAACAAVTPDLPPIVSLSGGHDSRAILAGARRARPDCIAATFRRPQGHQAEDVRIAELVARSLSARWECIEVSSSGADAEERLVWLKDGLNHTAMTFILSFLDELVRRFGERAVLLTGDGGDKIFPDLRPVRRLLSFDALVDLVVDEHALVPAAQVEELLGLPQGSLVEELRARLAAYPEPSLAEKAVHWKLAERSRKWLFEGEDRNRCFLWQASPCLSLSVFEAALRVPDEHKTDFRFYAEVQRHLDPALLALPHADTGLSIDSARFRLRALARRLALRAVGPLRRQVIGTFRAAEPVPPALRADTLARLAALHDTDSRLAQLLAPGAAKTCVEDASPRGLHDWRTLLLLDTLWSQRIAARVT
ncbi:MAG TPA: asparagine synthase-related protein [Planctomycetota bacterium]|nr:asparagine synthase-related protein [Planctomycetota bacterium]